MREYKYTIEQFIPFMKKGWLACDKCGTWCWFSSKPIQQFDYWDSNGTYIVELSNVFSIIPAKDWENSLIRVGGK